MLSAGRPGLRKQFLHLYWRGLNCSRPVGGHLRHDVAHLVAVEARGYDGIGSTCACFASHTPASLVAAVSEEIHEAIAPRAIRSPGTGPGGGPATGPAAAARRGVRSRRHHASELAAALEELAGLRGSLPGPSGLFPYRHSPAAAGAGAPAGAMLRHTAPIKSPRTASTIT
jgi:hypothetical protein